MRRAAKIDSSQPGIVDALQKAGASVQSLAAVGNGCPDLLVAYSGRTCVLECKSERGKLRPAQVEWIRSWRGDVHVVYSVDEALRAVFGWRKYD